VFLPHGRIVHNPTLTPHQWVYDRGPHKTSHLGSTGMILPDPAEELLTLPIESERDAFQQDSRAGTSVGHCPIRSVSYPTTPVAEKIARGWGTGGGSRNRLKPQGSREFSLSSHSHRNFLSLFSIPHSPNLSSLILAMFFNTQFLISAIMAVSVLGAPSVKRQDAGPACNALGSGAYSNRGHFKVAAFQPQRSQRLRIRYRAHSGYHRC